MDILKSDSESSDLLESGLSVVAAETNVQNSYDAIRVLFTSDCNPVVAFQVTPAPGGSSFGRRLPHLSRRHHQQPLSARAAVVINTRCGRSGDERECTEQQDRGASGHEDLLACVVALLRRASLRASSRPWTAPSSHPNRDLSYNELNGSIPESLGQLTSLQILRKLEFEEEHANSGRW